MVSSDVIPVAEPDPAIPPFPTTSIEFINTIVHYHRGEIARMAGWRDRLEGGARGSGAERGRAC